MLTLLSIFLIISFINLNKILKKMAFDSLTAYRNTIKKLFVLFTVSYVLRMGYTWFFGQYYKIICSQFGRDVAVLFLNLIWDILPISSILIMHHFNFRTFNSKELLNENFSRSLLRDSILSANTASSGEATVS